MRRSLIAAMAALLLWAAHSRAQEVSLAELFDNDEFYEQAGVLRSKGDIPFFADVSFLQGDADSTQAVLGIALSNSAFQFVKEDGGYRAAYEVSLRIQGRRGSFQNRWRETVSVASFDETLIERETVVFQSAFGLLPGEYELELEVRDTQGGEESKIDSDLTVPQITLPPQGHALSEPVLLRFFGDVGPAPARDYVLYPSHYYETVPREVSFFVEVYGARFESAQPRLVASIVTEKGGAAVSSATFDVPPLEDGSARVYGSVPGEGMESGAYRLAVSLQDAAGATLAESSTRLSVSAVKQWVKENWDEAVQLLAYEATDEERDRLEETPPGRRLEAWNEFWEVRDPVPASPTNEAFESYFRRIAVANANFGTTLRPGWKSDRGRVYIAFGPPSDIIRRPVPSGTFPLEVWVYDTPGFQIVFEDRIGFGNYQIANPGTFAHELAALERRKHRAIAERREARREGESGGGGAAPADTTQG